MSSLPDFNFQNSYARLPERFYSRQNPVPVAAPQLRKLNVKLAEELGLDTAALASPAGVAVLAGNRVAEGSEPLAIAYAGHQFGHFVPQLGDGRANLLGEVIGQDGVRYDLQLKGSGPTHFSRRGDGRAALGPVLREYIVSEAMHALGVPSTRALAAVTTGEQVVRETMQPGAILTRVAASHLRVGTFQYFAAQEDLEALRTLADYAIQRHYPDAAGKPNRYRLLLNGVINRQAKLVARWMSLGFIHGVMNTDNTSISGETIDYGPCAFMEAYEPDKTFSSIDRQGRYAYSNQPPAMHWNLSRLVETMLPFLVAETGSEDAALAAAREAIAAFMPVFEGARLQRFRAKLGLTTEWTQDATLIDLLLNTMAQGKADFTLTFRALCDAAEDPLQDAAVRRLFAKPDAYDVWAKLWRARLRQEPDSAAMRAESMRLENPIYIPRNHQVQQVIDAAVDLDNYKPLDDLLGVVLKPYEQQPGMQRFSMPARPEEAVTATFCGT